MGYSIKKNIKIAVKEETTEGTYIAPASGADFVQAQSDGIELTGAKETLEIDVIGLGLANAKPRNGLESANGALGVYMKAGSSATAEPEYGVMVESLTGTKRNAAAQTSGTTHTTTKINVSDTSSYKVGDVVVIKESGDFHTSPIASLVTNTSITLLIAMASAPADAVVVEAFTSYVTADDSHPSYSVSKYVEGTVLEQAVGCKTTSLSVDSFTTGQNASMKMGFEGADYSRSLTAIPYTPTYDTSETPVILDACIYQDGTKIEVNDFTLSIENSIGWIKDTCEGKSASRITGRTISGTINPYYQDNSIANFTKFDNNTSFSLFITAHNPTSTAGEYGEVVSFWLPVCVTTELGEGDIDGVMTETISFTVNYNNATDADLVISMS